MRIYNGLNNISLFLIYESQKCLQSQYHMYHLQYHFLDVFTAFMGGSALIPSLVCVHISLMHVTKAASPCSCGFLSSLAAEVEIQSRSDLMFTPRSLHRIVICIFFFFFSCCCFLFYYLVLFGRSASVQN